jgi:cysteinyl-tRNA synthetase
MIKLYNTLNRKKETLKPIKKGKVGLYTCGPTVYWFAHIGNLRTFLFEDVLKRVLEYNGYKVRHIMNITDVGHLTSDADVGEDKMEKGAKREKKTVWQVAEFYTKAFKKDLKRLNILPPDHWIKATQTIKDQIVLIKTLEEKGFTYKTSDGIYFDTSKLKTYGRLTGRKKKKIKAGARIKMVEGKKNPTDFALWKFSLKGQKRQMEWSSPWGIGFPGWHTECVVMSIKKLGIPFDVHCGGIDHVSIHHPNEIAQAEVAYGKIFANHWLHGEFLTLKEGKMAKSEGNIITLEDLIKKGFNPLAYRYLSFNAHYRSKLSFSWENLKASQNALDKFYERILEIKSDTRKLSKENYSSIKNYKNKFLEFINDDLNMPEALSLLWKVVKDKKLSNKEKYGLLVDFDKIFGFNLLKTKKAEIPKEVKELAEKRERFRKKADFKSADKTRGEILKLGYQVEDTKQGPKITKIN